MTSKEQLKAKVIEALKNVYDPEIPINIWDLGLIYDIRIDEDNIVHVTMTLTAPGCPVVNIILYQVVEVIQRIEGVKDVEVNVVFDPPWDPTKMTREGRERFKQIYGYDIVEEFARSRSITS